MVKAVSIFNNPHPHPAPSPCLADRQAMANRGGEKGVRSLHKEKK